MREKNQQIINSTMAEIMMLLLFIFFLYLFYLYFENEELKKNNENLLNKSISSLKEIESCNMKIDSDRKEILFLKSQYSNSKSAFFELRSCRENLAQNERINSKEADDLSRLKKELEDHNTTQVNLRSRISSLKSENLSLSEKITGYKKIILDGQGQKSCIRHSDDSVAAIFDVDIDLVNEKFSISKINLPSTLTYDIDIPMIKEKNKDGTILTKRQFISYSEELANHARDNNCKFYANMKFNISSALYKGKAASFRSIFELSYIPANPSYVIRYFR